MAAKKSPKPITEDNVETDKPETVEGKIYTYVGGGEDSPRTTVYFGQKFVRGKATEVTNEEALAKIAGNPAFIEGEIDEEELVAYDEKATHEADRKRSQDAKVNAAYTKKHRTE